MLGDHGFALTVYLLSAICLTQVDIDRERCQMYCTIVEKQESSAISDNAWCVCGPRVSLEGIKGKSTKLPHRVKVKKNESYDAP